MKIENYHGLRGKFCIRKKLVRAYICLRCDFSLMLQGISNLKLRTELNL